MEQAYIKDSEKKINDLMTETIATLGENITISRYTRFAVGESDSKTKTYLLYLCLNQFSVEFTQAKGEVLANKHGFELTLRRSLFSAKMNLFIKQI